ncbi:MAG TPA: hypothetical protein VFS10_03910 [Pyrinomonadaceae bacterium]|nr:hypothetical protein [Pyrinomonadaceae bacterium]
MCLDTGMLIWMLLFLLCVAASPFVLIAAIVCAVRRHRTDTTLRILN